PQCRAAGIRLERRRQAVGQHGEDEYAERLRGLGRDTLGEDVVRLERQVAVLLRRANREHHSVVTLEVLLDVHPVQLAGAHYERSSDAWRRLRVSNQRSSAYPRIPQI